MISDSETTIPDSETTNPGLRSYTCAENMNVVGWFNVGASLGSVYGWFTVGLGWFRVGLGLVQGWLRVIGRFRLGLGLVEGWCRVRLGFV